MMVKMISRFLGTIWKVIKGVGLICLLILAAIFPFEITDIFFHRIIIIITEIFIFGILNYFFGNIIKDGERYFLIIQLKFDDTISLFQKWLNREGFSACEKFDKKNLKWLKIKTREQCRVYNFYNVANKCTVISENILQDELRSEIDVLFSDEVKSVSDFFDTPIYYIAQEHSEYWYEVFCKGKQEKILSFYTHGPGIGQFKEQGESVSKEEIKKRDYYSDEDYIKGLGCPVAIDKKNIRKIIKSSLHKERLVFCKENRK